MKRFVTPFIFLFAFSCAFSQNMDSQAVQTVVPHEIFIGDTAELSYTFYSVINFNLEENESLPIKIPENFVSAINSSDYTVNSITLSKKKNQYQLFLRFVPWKTGFIEIPSFDLLTLIDESTSGFVINLSPIAVSSIVDKTGKNAMQKPQPPILVPGTIYFVYGIGVLVLIALILFVRFMFNIKKFAGSVSDFALFWSRMINARKTKRLAKKLLKNSNLSDKEFAERLEKIFRIYLAQRFTQNFTTITTNNITQYFTQLLAYNLTLNQTSNITSLTALFHRLDYIRYADGSLDALKLPEELHAAAFAKDEKTEIVSKTVEIVNFFESRERGNEDD